MIIQKYRTTCEDCGEELESRVADMTGDNEIIVDFIEGMEVYCDSCCVINHVEMQKYTRDV